MATVKIERAALPRVVSQAEWNVAHQALMAKEKELTRAHDSLAAERRRQPMVRIEQNYLFDGPNGKVSLLDLFEDRSQLIIYHFMFARGVEGWPSAGCIGCSMFTDNIGQFTLTHLAARDVSFALVSRAPFPALAAYKKRMSWTAPWVSSAENTFNTDLGITAPDGEHHGLSVFLRDGSEIYRTYYTTARGVEALASVWTFLDLTPFGRQETWEQTPPGRPQSAPYEWWQRHDEY